MMAHCNAKIVVGHQDLANSIQAIKMSDIYLMNYRKSYPFPSDLAKSLKEVFDFADMSREVPDSRKDDYEYILNAAKEYGKNTRFNIQEIVVMNPADKETRKYGNFYSAGGKTVIVPTSTARSSLRRSFIRTLVIGYSARRIVRPRAVLKEIANASKNEQLAAIIIHELKHSYDMSNEAIRRKGHEYEDRAPEESSVHHGNYDDYGGKNGEYSADTGAAIAYRHFKDVFQKVVNYVDKLIVAMEKDIKDTEAKAQSSQ